MSKELHSTRRAVSIDYRNREQKKMQKLAVYTDSLQKKVDEILLHQDQMIKLSQNCLKLGKDFISKLRNELANQGFCFQNLKMTLNVLRGPMHWS